MVRPPGRLEPGHRHRRPRTRRPGRRPARPGRERVRRLRPAPHRRAAQGASGYIRTPSGGLHAYFTGSAQRNGHLPTQHLDFRSAGGYVLAPPSQVRGKPYQRIRTLDGQAGLDWQAVIRLLEPDRQYQQPATRPLPDYGITRLVRWVAAQREGNRNAGLFWAANRALDADPAADLNELAAAARQAGLPEQEITRTLNSARRTRHAPQRPWPPGRRSQLT